MAVRRPAHRYPSNAVQVVSLDAGFPEISNHETMNPTLAEGV